MRKAHQAATATVAAAFGTVLLVLTGMGGAGWSATTVRGDEKQPESAAIRVSITDAGEVGDGTTLNTDLAKPRSATSPSKTSMCSSRRQNSRKAAM